MPQTITLSSGCSRPYPLEPSDSLLKEKGSRNMDNSRTQGHVSAVGSLVGQHLDSNGNIIGEIIHNLEERRREGPAENAFIYLEIRNDRRPRARYVSWINLYDVEYAGRRQPGHWRLSEPAEPRKVTFD